MVKQTNLQKFLESQSYKKDFKDLMLGLEKKYGADLIEENGIGSQLDISKSSKKFFKAFTTADVSVDANANVTDKSVISHKIETAKPFHLINSYYRLWKEIKKIETKEKADWIVESQIKGRMYINDFVGFSSAMAYSYYGKTSLVVKYKGQILSINMEELFDMFSDKIVELPDRETIDLSNVNIYVLDEGNKFVKLTHVLRHKSHCDLVKLETKNGFTTIVTQDHPVILEDNTEKLGGKIEIGDKLKISDCKLDIFDSKNTNIDRRKYLIGFGIGDGYLTGGNEHAYQLGIIQKDLKNHKIYEYAHEEFDNVSYYNKAGRKNVQTMVFGNKCFICQECDIKKGAENKTLPKDILNWDRNEILSLLAGIIDADGCVNNTSGVIDIRIASFTAVQQIAELLRWIGCDRVRTSLVKGYEQGNSFMQKLDLYRVSFITNDEIFISYSDKMSKNKELILRERQKDGRFETNEVLKIMPFEQEYVYDITTETGHFHSQGMIQHNCFNYSTYDTATMGIPSVFDGRGGSEPPKNLMSFLGQIELFSLIAGNSTLGATGLADLLIVIAIYMDKMLQNKEDAHVPMVDDKACWQYMESMLTGFIYRLNQPYRGSQSLFSNVSVYDSNFIDGMLEGDAYSIIIDDVKYSAKKEIVQKVQEIYLDIMNREMARKPITFPVTTACFSIDENNEIQDDDFLKFISEKNLKFGFINIYAGKSSTLSSCCRLRSERDNGEYFNSFGSGSTKIGSLGVATGNLPQLATICKGAENPSDEFLHRIKDLVLDCQLVNQAKRNIIKRTIKAGSQPLYSLGYMELKRQYSTFGVIGLYEALEILGYDIMTKEGQDYVLEILNVINTTNKELQDKYKAPQNCEQIPGENVSVKLAKKDRALGYNDKYTLYSNQFIPLIKRVNMFDRIAIQALFDKHFSGGAICHLNVNQEITDANTMQNLIHASVKEGVVYFAVNFVLQECENKHMFVGNVDTCPHCGGKIIGTFTRVVGFLTKVDNWIPERREVDFPNRQFYQNIEL